MIINPDPSRKSFLSWTSNCCRRRKAAQEDEEMGSLIIKAWKLQVKKAPQLVNLSLSMEYDRKEIEKAFSISREKARIDYSCGGKALKNLWANAHITTLTTHSNTINGIAAWTLDCPYVLGVTGYDFLDPIPNYQGHAGK